MEVIKVPSSSSKVWYISFKYPCWNTAYGNKVYDWGKAKEDLFSPIYV